jgi:hypothetical protein
MNFNLTPSQTDIIFGVLIGSIPTFVYMLTNLYFQNKHEDKIRKWQLEDQERNEYFTRLKIRVKEAENILQTVYESGLSFISQERSILNAVGHPEDKESVMSGLNDFSPVMYSQHIYLSNVISIGAAVGDQELEDAAREFESLLSRESSNLIKLADCYFNDKPINLKREDNRLSKSLVKYSQAHGLLLEKLDSIVQKKLKLE